MTKQELDEIRKKLADEPRVGYVSADRFGNLITCTRENMAVTLLAEVDRLIAERDAARNMLDGICSEFEGVVAHADWKAAGSKGMSVPFFGDFASAVQLPSLVGRMRWWANEMRKVIGGKVE
jgi:hypothetical protein